MTKSKPQLMIASWPLQPVRVSDLYPDVTNVSARIHFRMIDPNDKWLSGTDEARAATDLGLYVWADIDGTISIDLRAMDIYSASLREMQARVKLLKRLDAKATKAGFTMHDFHRNASMHDTLTKAVAALGIHTSIEYRGIGQPDTFAPAGIAIKRIADALDAQLESIRRRRAA